MKKIVAHFLFISFLSTAAFAGPNPSTRENKGCLMAVASLGWRAGTYPFRSVKGFLISSASLVGTAAVLGGTLVYPIYPTQDGTMSPLVRTYVFFRDHSKAGPSNQAQLDALNARSPQETAIKIAETKFPQGVKMPAEKTSDKPQDNSQETQK